MSNWDTWGLGRDHQPRFAGEAAESLPVTKNRPRYHPNQIMDPSELAPGMTVELVQVEQKTAVRTLGILAVGKKYNSTSGLLVESDDPESQIVDDETKIIALDSGSKAYDGTYIPNTHSLIDSGVMPDHREDGDYYNPNWYMRLPDTEN